MDRELVEKVTKLVLGKLNEQSQTEKPNNQAVKFWSHGTPAAARVVEAPTSVQKSSEDDQGVKFFNSTPSEAKSKSTETIKEIKPEPTKTGIVNPVNEEDLLDLISKTPARIGVGRAGLRPKTNTWLKFRFDHAAAVDAVYGSVNDELLKQLELFKVNTQVTDKEVYIRRPDYGRKLSNEAKEIITKTCKKSPTVQIIVSDGLSSKAIEENLEDVYLSLQQSLKSLQIDVGTPFYIEKGRVAAMDDVGELLKPKVVVLLIGERPGLVSAESLSAYLCFEPKKGTIEADRMVVSNIHRGGIPPVEAGAYLGTVIQKILKYEASGVSLVQKEQ
ncbi:ethanolamine ammonia-lyase subunit EutC [Cytobacillus sp. S13-E01]|uniref:ethanolamine ammonia-lyase subunit EutC n=1 Tax=Cytobacillus sp. S13-E01 TaxID=3031326 RepID=UPI0023D7F8F2|nr:ethanolamine ammonia-lyase subunit EutC [Cytobacillus sp. S13-E01]MDF0725992.1 ethanolamine ammonia-lyase subunit EutC [Cytobacillus sp. S13-E01]